MHNYYNIPQRIKIIYIINKVVQPFWASLTLAQNGFAHAQAELR
jgi:hypothetical protein